MFSDQEHIFEKNEESEMGGREGQPIVLVEENLSTEVFITVAGEELIWPVTCVGHSERNGGNGEVTCSIERCQIVIISNT